MIEVPGFLKQDDDVFLGLEPVFPDKDHYKLRGPAEAGGRLLHPFGDRDLKVPGNLFSVYHHGSVCLSSCKDTSKFG